MEAFDWPTQGCDNNYYINFREELHYSMQARSNGQIIVSLCFHALQKSTF